jgi:hypothetical protein
MAYLDSLTKRSELVQFLTVMRDSQEVNLVKFCSDNMNIVLEDLNQLIKNVEEAESTKKLNFIQKLKLRFKRSGRAISIYLNEDHIKNLIQEAKHFESSLQMGLSIALCMQHDHK